MHEFADSFFFELPEQEVIVVRQKGVREYFYDALSLFLHPMRLRLIGLEKGFFEVEERCRRFVIEFVEIVNKTEIIALIKKDGTPLHPAAADVVDVILRKCYLSHVSIL